MKFSLSCFWFLIGETLETAEAVLLRIWKSMSYSLTHLLTDNLKARDASASKKDNVSGSFRSPLVAIQISPSRAYVKGQILEIKYRAYFKGVRHIIGEGVVKFKVQFNDTFYDQITDYESYDDISTIDPFDE